VLRLVLEFCRDRQGDVLRFTTDTTIWPTNNISERGVRPLKTQQKISGRLTGDDVTQDRFDIRGYVDTARQHALGAYEVLRRLMTGDPWLPPAQPISRNTEGKRDPPITQRSIGVNAHLSLTDGGRASRLAPSSVATGDRRLDAANEAVGGGFRERSSGIV
jgi:hypothetical protein